MKFIYMIVLTVFNVVIVRSQIFYGSGAPIPDNGSDITFEIPVSGLPPALDTLNFGIENICINITHTWTADLNVSLIAPDNTIIALTNGLGGDTDGYLNTCFNSNATSSIFEANFPFTGEYRPFGDMGKINNGQNPNGVWRLLILDTYPFADEGVLTEWSISFGDQPCTPFPFYSSDLPIIKIHTNGQVIVNEPKIMADFVLIDNGTGQTNFVNQTNPTYEGLVGIELRGRSSQGYPKKSFDIEFRDKDGNDKPVSILSLPEESDFILHGNYSDKTLMRNALAYETFRQMGHYATRTRFCEVLIDGSYQGVYTFTEDIKRGKNRVDIAKLTPDDTDSTDLTGGYIVKIDWNTSPGWNSQFSQPSSPNNYTYFQHQYPKWNVIQPEQDNYIRQYIDSFELALDGTGFQDQALGWRRFADEKSFIDYLILNEWSKNVDGYRLSTYLYKDRDDKNGKLSMGPPWDYDLAWYNADYCDNFLTTGWAYDINYVCDNAGVPFWWEKLVSDTLFSQNLACRWFSLREAQLSDAQFYGKIDSMANLLNQAQSRNFSLWPTLGIYLWPNPGVLPETHLGEVEKMKNWISERATWLSFQFEQLLPDFNSDFLATPNNALSWQFLPTTTNTNFQYHWDFDDGTTSNEPTPQHQFPGTGTYEVLLTKSTPYGCEKTSKQIIHIVDVNASNLLADNDIMIYPNPADDKIWVQFSNSIGVSAQLRLFNTLGNLVYESNLNKGIQTMQIDLTNIQSGVYYIEIIDADNRFYRPFIRG